MALLPMSLIAVVLVFGLAGRWDLWNVWVYAGIHFLLGTFVILAVYRKKPDLVKERVRPPTLGSDVPLRIGYFVMLLLHWCIGGLDQRFHWSDVVPPVGAAVGLMIVAIGLGLLTWSVSVNAFFSSVTRIQADRGQQIVDKGPYALVRHPGYAGSVLYMVASGMALNSLLSIIPAVIGGAFFVQIAAMEDQMLSDELPGYADYAAKVRYRLIPGVW